MNPLPPSSVRDLSVREVLALAPLIVFMFWIGVHPNFFTSRMSASLDPVALAASQRFENFYRPRDAAPVASEPAVGLPAEPASDPATVNRAGPARAALPSTLPPALPAGAPLGEIGPRDRGRAVASAEETARVD